MPEVWSIQRRLPLLFVAVLVIVVATLAAASYAAVRAQALAAVEERLQRLVDQLAADVASPGLRVQLERVATAADAQPVRDFLAGIAVDDEAVRAALRSAAGPAADSARVGLWSGAGSLLLEAVPGRLGPLAGVPPLLGDSAAVSPLRAVDDSTVFYDLAAPVRAEGRTVGAVAVRGRLTPPSTTLELILGPSGGLLVGTPDGSLWTAGGRVVASPPPGVLLTEGLASFERGGVAYVGVATSVAPIPWVVLVEVGRAEALAPASAFLVRILTIAAVLIALGAAMAWALARRLTAPLGTLAEAVSGISAGDYSRRVALVAPAEVAHLGSAVNSMAEQVQVRTHALASSESRLRSLVNATAQIVWYARPDGRVDGSLPSWQAYTGQTDEQVAGERWTDAVHQDDRASFDEMWGRAPHANGPIEFECRIRGHDGTFRFFAVRGVQVHAEAGEIREWVGTCANIEEQRAAERELRRAEQAAREHEERYHTLFNTLIEGFCIIEVLFDAEDHPVDYRFLEVNAAFESLTGLRDAQGKRMREFAPDHEEHWFEVYGRIALTGEPARFVNEAKALKRWHDVSAYKVGGPDSRKVAILFNDVSDIKSGEQRIRAQLEHLRLLDNITTSIGERLDPGSIFQVVVRSLEESLPTDFACVCLHDPVANALRVSCVGLKNEALARDLTMGEMALIGDDDDRLGRWVQGTLVYEPDLGEARSPFPARLARGGLGSVVMAPLQSESHVFGVLVVARRDAHAFSGVECEFLRQVSEHVALASHQAQLYGALRQAYDDLRQTQQVMMQEERLRALGQMASGIAHDINNALSPVSLYVESMLETESSLSDRARGYLEAISRAVADVAQTVARMREFYRPREIELVLRAVQMNTMVQQVVELTRARWNDMPQQRGIVIRALTELEPDLPEVMGVEGEIREALTNLVFNAVDALPGGGTLTVRTGVRDPGTDRAAVVVEVADSGVGMDEETRRRCLEPFFTTKGERGTGLGLAMVFGMVQRHSAELEVDSVPGSGTTVRLVFAVPGTISAEDEPPGAVRGVPSRLRLLVIDDDPMLLKSLGDTLETDGHVIVTAHGGEVGIVAFRKSLDGGPAFAAVITDLGMPYVDGRRVAAAVKEASPSTPVIMLTGWGRRLLAEGDVPPHVDRLLAKPPKLRELREALAQLCPPGAR
jgi:PAS domain S-box-containing protein